MEAKVPLKDVLAARYASTPLVNRWGEEEKIKLERRLWVATLKAQKDLGLAIPEEAIVAYERVVELVHLGSIRYREITTRQDVKARIDEFNTLAGYELIHQGFTSRELTDNIEQFQIRRSLLHARERTVAVLYGFGLNSLYFKTLDICGRSHNVPGQTTTLGKRFATLAEELLIGFDRLEHLVANYPLRGIKGAMGTQQDMLHLLGSAEKVEAFERKIMEHLGFSRVLDSTGQVYPRSLDFEVVSVLVQMGSALGNFAKMIRLMAGHELLHEGFKEGQTASTAQGQQSHIRTHLRTSQCPLWFPRHGQSACRGPMA